MKGSAAEQEPYPAAPLQYDVRLDKPHYTHLKPRMQVQLILNRVHETEDEILMLSGRVDTEPRDQDGLPTMAFTCDEGEDENEYAERAVRTMAHHFFGVTLDRTYLLKLGTLTGATGVYVRNHVFWYVQRTHEVWVREDWFLSGTHVTWERHMVPPQPSHRDREQLMLLWGLVRERQSVTRDWHLRGFGTHRVRSRPVRRQAHHQYSVCVVLRDEEV